MFACYTSCCWFGWKRCQTWCLPSRCCSHLAWYTVTIKVFKLLQLCGGCGRLRKSNLVQAHFTFSFSWETVFFSQIVRWFDLVWLEPSNSLFFLVEKKSKKCEFKLKKNSKKNKKMSQKKGKKNLANQKHQKDLAPFLGPSQNLRQDAIPPIWVVSL